MRCPKCHNENKYDALTCDFCMATLPMSEERMKEIKEKKKIEKKAKMHNTMVKLTGLLIGIGIVVGIIVVVYLMRS